MDGETPLGVADGAGGGGGDPDVHCGGCGGETWGLAAVAAVADDDDGGGAPAAAAVAAVVAAEVPHPLGDAVVAVMPREDVEEAAAYPDVAGRRESPAGGVGYAPLLLLHLHHRADVASLPPRCRPCSPGPP